MAVTRDQLAYELRISTGAAIPDDDPEGPSLDRSLGAAAAVVERVAGPSTPAPVVDQATLVLAKYLHDQPLSERAHFPARNSGALALLAPWRVHRALPFADLGDAPRDLAPLALIGTIDQEADNAAQLGVATLAPRGPSGWELVPATARQSAGFGYVIVLGASLEAVPRGLMYSAAVDGRPSTVAGGAFGMGGSVVLYTPVTGGVAGIRASWAVEAARVAWEVRVSTFGVGVAHVSISIYEVSI